MSYLYHMQRQEILDRLARKSAAFESLGVASLRLFGSHARDQAHDSSDADFVVQFVDPPTFDRLMDLKFQLEEALGIPVDLTTEAALRPQMRQRIERDAVRVA